MGPPDTSPGLEEELKALRLKVYDWLKYILGVMATVLGLLIGLKTAPSHTALEHWLFVAGIGCLAAGLVVGIVAILLGLIHDGFELIKLPLKGTSIENEVRAHINKRHNMLMEWTNLTFALTFILFIGGLASLVVYVAIAFAPGDAAM